MSKKLSLARDINRRAEYKFPNYEVDFDVVDGETTTVTFRNVIRLTKAERREYNNAQSDLQRELAEAMEKAREAAENDDTETLESLQDLDSTELLVGLLRKQLAILATDREQAEVALANLDEDQIITLNEFVVGGGVAEGESSTSPNS